MTEYTEYPRPDKTAAPRQPETIGELIESWSREVEEKREQEQKRREELKNRPPRNFGEWLARCY